LMKWNKLPESRRRPGAVRIEPRRSIDLTYERRLPRGGIVLNVYTRALERNANGELTSCESLSAGYAASARDHLWLTEEEWKSLLPARPNEGLTIPLPATIAQRILRFHFVDNTRGEPPLWRADQIRKRDLQLVVEKVTPQIVRLRVQGSAILSSSPDTRSSDRGFDADVLGYVEFEPVGRTVTRFDLVAVGEHWGEGSFTRGARPGHSWLGIAFELAAPGSIGYDVPPQGARELADYLGRGK